MDDDNCIESAEKLEVVKLELRNAEYAIKMFSELLSEAEAKADALRKLIALGVCEGE